MHLTIFYITSPDTYLYMKSENTSLFSYLLVATTQLERTPTTSLSSSDCLLILLMSVRFPQFGLKTK